MTPPTWEPQTNAIKFGVSAFTFMVSWLSYAKTRSIVLICDSSMIKTDQLGVQWRHWYGSHMLCSGCKLLRHALLRSLALIHDVRTFTGTCRHFDTITHVHWQKPDILWHSRMIKCKGGVFSRNDFIISLKLCPKKETYWFFSSFSYELAIVAI